MNKKEVIVPADDLVCLGKDKLHELIRCKDCKHGTPCRFYESTWYVCTRNNVGIDMNADDYCSRAERIVQ